MHKALVVVGALALFISLRVFITSVAEVVIAQTPPCKDCRPAVTLVEP